jgi:hypothetical protein
MNSLSARLAANKQRKQTPVTKTTTRESVDCQDKLDYTPVVSQVPRTVGSL